MPTVLTRGAGSARGFGLFESGITTRKERFTSNGSWVCPAGVTSLIYVQGKGQNGTSDYTVYRVYYYQGFSVSSPATRSNPPYGDWSTLYGQATADYASVPNGGISGPTAVTGTQIRVAPDNTWDLIQAAPVDFDGLYTWNVNLGSNGSPPTSGPIVYGAPSAYFVLSLYYEAPGYPGDNTTGFGYTFNGGTLTGTYPGQVGNPATVTTYTSVSVTPGTTYNFVVPSGGYVEFAYYT